jgi:methylmalonyl-CoA/ethylmalonyl-CoA epimerase
VMEIKEANLRKADYKVGGSMLEFFEGSPGSMFGEWLEKNGEGVHHIAYEVEDIEGELKKQAELGVTLIDKEPRVMPGAKIAFIGPDGASGVMIELVEPARG